VTGVEEVYEPTGQHNMSQMKDQQIDAECRRDETGDQSHRSIPESF